MMTSRNASVFLICFQFLSLSFSLFVQTSRPPFEGQDAKDDMLPAGEAGKPSSLLLCSMARRKVVHVVVVGRTRSTKNAWEGERARENVNPTSHWRQR